MPSIYLTAGNTEKSTNGADQRHLRLKMDQKRSNSNSNMIRNADWNICGKFKVYIIRNKIWRNGMMALTYIGLRHMPYKHWIRMAMKNGSSAWHREHAAFNGSECRIENFGVRAHLLRAAEAEPEYWLSWLSKTLFQENQSVFTLALPAMGHGNVDQMEFWLYIWWKMCVIVTFHHRNADSY